MQDEELEAQAPGPLWPPLAPPQPLQQPLHKEEDEETHRTDEQHNLHQVFVGVGMEPGGS